MLTLAGLGKFTLWGAVLVDVGTALLVILNGMTVLRWTRHAPGEATQCVAERHACEHRWACTARRAVVAPACVSELKTLKPPDDACREMDASMPCILTSPLLILSAHCVLCRGSVSHASRFSSAAAAADQSGSCRGSCCVGEAELVQQHVGGCSTPGKPAQNRSGSKVAVSRPANKPCCGGRCAPVQPKHSSTGCSTHTAAHAEPSPCSLSTVVCVADSVPGSCSNASPSLRDGQTAESPRRSPTRTCDGTSANACCVDGAESAQPCVHI